MINKVKISFLSMLIIIITINRAVAYEEATYSIVYQNDIYEIRNYGERLAIQANDTKQEGAFRKLFNYISGSNINSTKIDMTIPAIQSNENGSKIMQFFLPSYFTKNNAPEPNDKDLKLIIIEQGYYATIKYSGRLSDKNFDKRKKNLEDNLMQDNIKILSPAIRATYNGPFTLPLLRRNEVMFRVSWKDE